MSPPPPTSPTTPTLGPAARARRLQQGIRWATLTLAVAVVAGVVAVRPRPEVRPPVYREVVLEVKGMT